LNDTETLPAAKATLGNRHRERIKSERSIAVFFLNEFKNTYPLLADFTEIKQMFSDKYQVRNGDAAVFVDV